MHSTFKNEAHLPGMGIDLSGYATSDVFKVRTFIALKFCEFTKTPINN